MSRITPRTSDSPSAVMASSPPSRTPETRAVTRVCALGTCNPILTNGCCLVSQHTCPVARTLWSHLDHVKQGACVSQPETSEVQAITRASRILAALEAAPGGLSL